MSYLCLALYSTELKIFSKERYVFLGHHTNDHTMLTTYSINDVKLQLLEAQNTLYDITGTRPPIISYPYGIHTHKIISAAKEIGLQLGLTVEPKKNYLLKPPQRLKSLGLTVPSGSPNRI